MKITAVGGGKGLSRLLEGLREFDVDMSVIVTVFDSGGSSGRLREELGIMAVGDLRRCIASLSPLDAVWLEERFGKGNLKGHAIGNILLASLIKYFGSVDKAVEAASRLFSVKGRILPISLDAATLCAKLENGNVIRGEANIDKPENREMLKIREIFLDPKAKMFPKAAEALKDADMLVIGPGDLYTSVIPNMLVDGFKEAVRESKAKRVYVCNILEKKSETFGYAASRHVEEIAKYMGCKPDYVICDSSGKGGNRVRVDRENLESFGIKLIEKDVSDGTAHDSKRLAECIVEIAGGMG